MNAENDPVNLPEVEVHPRTELTYSKLGKNSGDYRCTEQAWADVSGGWLLFSTTRDQLRQCAGRTETQR